jgi:aminoglycoside/choline kinase family phosphotransferase
MFASDLPERVTAYLERSGLGAEATTVLPLTGDASDRRYFRVLRRNGPSRVLALHVDTFDPDALPFSRVAQLLAAMPLPIPAILDRAGDLGILLLEDLGDITLQAHLGAAPAAEHSRLYRYAVSLIEALQRRGAELASPGYPPYGVAFDVDKLLWELEFFTKHYVEAYRGASISAPDRDALKAEWRRLADELAGEPRVLCHRDYHSRNLMLHQGELYIIDFQDARMGPDTYDLVSLLRDSYVDLSEATVDELIAYFIALKRPQGGDAIAHRAWEQGFRRRFDVMALQRNLKALGTFGYQTSTRRNPVYIQYIPRTIRHVQTNLLRNPDRFGRLRGLLSTYMDELR